MLPDGLRRTLDGTGLLVARAREECKLIIEYRDEAGQTSRRTVWPVALGFFERIRMLAAWCELRQGFRHFRLDRIAALEFTQERYPRERIPAR